MATIDLLTESYYVLMKNFFDLVSKSDSMKELNYPISSLSIGIHSIHRVFEYAIMKTKSIEKALYYAQNTYYYYLEYMNQIHQSNLSQSLNHIDAVLFVYKKTIFDLSNSDNDTMNNIMTLNNDSISFEPEECKTLFLRLSKLMDVLFYYSNNQLDFFNRKNICDHYLYRFLRLFSYKTPVCGRFISEPTTLPSTFSMHKDVKYLPHLDITLLYLEVIQQKINMQYDKYQDLLEELLEKNEKQKRSIKKKSMDITMSEDILFKFCIEDSLFKSKYEQGNMKELVKWLFV